MKTKAEAEYYFIQFLYCKNNELLKKEYRPLYDAMFEKYEKLYKLAREKHQDISVVNQAFMTDFGASILKNN